MLKEIYLGKNSCEGQIVIDKNKIEFQRFATYKFTSKR